ncbi:DUF799 domain-containing protein [Buttiauxella ferragutiae]|jgi:hypothetical protein|uniref:DUF799 domain-containing protein n=2 Tax=Buttiauxella ferragutiae TaxID=82989 RepID=UPI001F52C94F|nr:DUF799 domain-containing protein [Buttiauxella ferragutiae]UNK63232.1 DUF799 domain-containing protein [Buttiauxella ferragutiae]
MKSLFAVSLLIISLLLTGCAKPGQVQTKDYSAFKESKPRSILVLLPKNQSTDVDAGHSLLSVVTYPLAEGGYYVFPVAVVEETFKQNGLSNAEDINAVSTTRLHQIFGADAVLYLNIEKYGTSYQVINSDTRVSASARLVDLRSGKELWTNSATASSDENDNNYNNGLLTMVVSAAIEQIENTVGNKSHEIAGITSARLLNVGSSGGLLYGPRSPVYAKTAL